MDVLARWLPKKGFKILPKFFDTGYRPGRIGDEGDKLITSVGKILDMSFEEELVRELSEARYKADEQTLEGDNRNLRDLILMWLAECIDKIRIKREKEGWPSTVDFSIYHDISATEAKQRQSGKDGDSVESLGDCYLNLLSSFSMLSFNFSGKGIFCWLSISENSALEMPNISDALPAESSPLEYRLRTSSRNFTLIFSGMLALNVLHLIICMPHLKRYR